MRRSEVITVAGVRFEFVDFDNGRGRTGARRPIVQVTGPDGEPIYIQKPDGSITRVDTAARVQGLTAARSPA